ncbi:MAG: hypothetical protein V4548_03570 [Bacteroidota bacterium]
MKNTLHIGNMLQDYFNKNGVSKAALSRALQTAPSSLEARLKKATMPTDFLLKISTLLEHNFFADIAATLPLEFSSDTQRDATQEEKIATLELELKLLQRENETLTNLIVKKLEV